MTSAALEQGRSAFNRRLWGDAFAQMSLADRHTPLAADDLDNLATAAYLLGKDAECTDAWARAHEEYLRLGNNQRAARCAFWTAYVLMNSGEMARAGGWLARAGHLVEESEGEWVERGYLLAQAAIETCGSDPDASYAVFTSAEDIGRRFGDADLIGLARHGQGRALIRAGQPDRAMVLLDEVLVALTNGELSPIVTGDTYCGVIEACHESFDMRRAQEWTAAFTRWCEGQPDLVAYRGQCLVYRASLTQMRGAWTEALAESLDACERLSSPGVHPSAGSAYYQRAEIQRLRGDLAAAEDSYRLADRYGREPQPGLALLRLAQGRPDLASASARRMLSEARDPLTAARVLSACVEILLAAGDTVSARAAADELSKIVAQRESPFLIATGTYAEGAVRLAEARARDALGPLRAAYAGWRELGAPHEAARARVLIGLACLALGDHDSAELEWQAARTVFEELGAALDLARLPSIARDAPAAAGLTTRELDILRLVATGKTNRAIGDELVISDKTVARHVSNIFVKLGVSSRTAATAYAFEHRLV